VESAVQQAPAREEMRQMRRESETAKATETKHVERKRTIGWSDKDFLGIAVQLWALTNSTGAASLYLDGGQYVGFL
jgi:hypothetical protein